MRKNFGRLDKRFNMISFLSWVVIIATIIIIILIGIGVIR